ncbi:bifunctional demethylmenaquinone methyltransferase/2-methoxy-6-polyprenyl-1,4-benzoquinol methylase UbiE [Alphaproteobacteria bacterium]|nr:bifunctional demethylmenaquinone methyltransferase/2-methoxy-6-polyprenyl-1,4-benzoquinol methylase UbiE [Alphaproteobacteria bacterium]
MTEKSYRYGHEHVSYKDKIQGVARVFSAVAPQYDLMNDLMSLGLHRRWKNHLVSKLAPFPGMVHLDLAGGTGDIATRILQKTKAMTPTAHVYVGDYSAEMLQEGRNRAIDSGIHDQLSWIQLNGEALPFPDARFDSITLSFGLRNMAKLDQVLSHMHRILKPGGKALIMEFSKPAKPFVPLAQFYNHKFLPFMGEHVANNRDAYQYLADSIDTFPDQETLSKMLRKANFERVSYENLAGGIVAIHQGIKS